MVSFVASYKNITPLQAAIEINKQYQLNIPLNYETLKINSFINAKEKIQEVNQIAAKLFNKNLLFNDENKAAYDYLIKRGLK